MHIDLLSPASFVGGHPHDQYDWLRRNAPVHWHDDGAGDGFWAISRYADVNRIGRNAEAFSSEPTIMIADPDLSPVGANGEYKMMLTMDPPQHTAYRKLISREFTQGPARRYQARIQQLAKRIVDAVIDRGECEFVSEIAGEMPSFVIADLMGLPLEDGRKLYELTEVIHTAPEELPEGAIPAAVVKMFEYGQGVIEEKRRHPADDLATKLLQAEVEGRRLADEEFLLFFMLLIDAGGDTTRNLVSTGLRALLQHPDQLARLTAEPDRLMPTAREELLRWTSPVIYMRRRVTQPTTLGGQALKAGDRVVMYYGAANRDPDAFPQSDRLDLQRSPNRHLAFGSGHHICLGQWFARLEIDAILSEVLRRMKNIRIVGELAWMPSNFISGLTHMPVAFDS